MKQSHDRRIHADALRRQERDNAFQRFKRQAGAMLASVALGGMAAPYMLLAPQTMPATALYVQANAEAWITRGTQAHPTVRITYAGLPYNVPARSVADAPYYRQAARALLADVARGGCLGFALWVASLFLLRDINDLVARGILERDAAGGRSTSYSLVQDAPLPFHGVRF